MSKTITVRIDDTIYDMFKKDADGQKRTISKYIEYATINYIVSETIIDDIEVSDVSAGRYTIIG